MLEKSWKRNKNRGKHAFCKTLILSNKLKIFIVFLMDLVLTFADTAEPLLLKQVISYVESDESSKHGLTKALIYTVLYLLFIFLYKILNQQKEFYKLMFKVQIKQATIAMLYGKVLRVSPATNKKISKGRMVNMIQNDSDNSSFIYEQLTKALRLPFGIISVLISLYVLINWVLAVVIGITIVIIFVNYILAKWNASVQKLWLKYIDMRLQKISEATENIKVLKFN